jgi:hypothetical protein
MILHALIARKWRWFAISFVYKSAIDGIVAWLPGLGINPSASPWLMDALLIAPFALIGVLVLLKLRREWDASPFTAASCRRWPSMKPAVP